MKKSTAVALLFSIVLLSRQIAVAQPWSIAGDYSTTSNPNGVWIYGRTLTSHAADVDVMDVRWNERGESGWYLGNFGHGGPSVWDNGPSLWAKDNSNGFPVIRWIAPEADFYTVAGAFEGNDSRGVNNLVYVAVNGTVRFNDALDSPTDSAPFALSGLPLSAGDHVDFLLTNNGGNTEFGWTRIDATITRTSTGIGGSVVGMTPANVLCWNLTTGESVSFQTRNAVWDCEAAGLVVNSGDRVFTGAEGIAE